MNLDEFQKAMRDFQTPYDEQVFADLRYFPGFPRVASSPLWTTLGFEETSRSDINKDPGTLYLDLNEELTGELMGRRFDLVTDFGNNEHVFDVAEAFRTTHTLTRHGGLIWTNQAIWGGNGFYNFDEIFFESLAASNQYSIVYCDYQVSTKLGGRFNLPKKQEVRSLLNLGALEGLAVNYIFRKLSDQEFQIPHQGGEGSNESPLFYVVDFLGDQPSLERAYIPSESAVNVRLRTLIRIALGKIRLRIKRWMAF
jgi:hypothetical protein